MRAPLRRVRCRLVARRAGEVVVRTDEGEEVSLGTSGSAEDASALAGADGIAVVAEHVTRVAPGDLVGVRWFG